MHVEALHVVSSVENVSYLTASVNLMLRSLTTGVYYSGGDSGIHVCVVGDWSGRLPLVPGLL